MAGPKIRIKLRAYDHRMLDVAARDIVEHVTRTGAKVVGPVPLPTERSIYTVIRSPHKYKDSREHFQMLTHKRLIDIVDATSKTVQELQRLNLSAGVDIEIKLSGAMAETKGILGTKLGMTQIFDDTRAVPVTVIKAGPAVVSQVKTKETDGYDAVQLSFGTVRPRNLTRPMKGHFESHDATPGRHVVELRTDDAGSYEPGQEITVDVFSPGDRVDVVGVSKGHGTTGVMKRHGFHGLRASHGTKRKHRAPGAIGACATPSRVFKDMPMAGQHGSVRVTVLNLEVVQADVERGLLLVKGAVPGPNGGLLMARSAVKAPAKGSA